MPLTEQCRAAKQAGFSIVSSPDAPDESESPTPFIGKASKAGAPNFVRDYNLPIYPDGRVGAKELAAPAVITAARGEAEPLSLGGLALPDLNQLTFKVGELTAGAGISRPTEAVRVRYVEAACIRTPQRASRTAVLASLRVRPLGPLPLARGLSRLFWIGMSVQASVSAA